MSEDIVVTLETARHVLLREDGDRDLGFQSNITTDASLAIAAALKTSIDTIEALRGENARLKGALEVPKVWTEEERDGMMNAWRSAREKHGMNETIFAMAAWLLRYRAAKALGETT